MVGLEAPGVEGHVALGAHVHSLGIPLPHLEAPLAVAVYPLPVFVHVSLCDPMIQSVIPVNAW